MHRRQWEILARADRLFAFELTVARKFDFLAEHLALQPIHQLREGVQLLLAGMGLLEIADEADADCGEVELVALYVAAEQLLVPAGAHFDFSIARVDAVADHKVVGQAVLHAALAMSGIVFPRVAIFDRAVVHDNTAPVVAANVDFGGRNTGHRKLIDQWCVAGGRDLQLLVDSNEIVVQAVGLFDCADADAVSDGDVPQGVAFLHDVNRVRFGGCDGCASGNG